MEDNVVLTARGISMTFPGVKALDDVDFTLRKGEIHALMGENGAGKSTLMKCLFGIYKMDAGEIYIDGEKTTIENPDEAPRWRGLPQDQESGKLQGQSVVLNVKTRKLSVKLVNAGDKEKKTNVFYLVQASTLEGARKNIDEVMGGTMIDYRIAAVSETNIIDVFEYVSK